MYTIVNTKTKAYLYNFYQVLLKKKNYIPVIISIGIQLIYIYIKKKTAFVTLSENVCSFKIKIEIILIL